MAPIIAPALPFRFTDMRANWMIGTMLATVAVAQAQDRKLVIYVQQAEYVGLAPMTFAENIANRILAQAGVRVQWKAGQPRTSARGTLTVTIDIAEPADVSAGALAYALPFQEGAAIHVIYPRVAATGPKGWVPTLLGHVLAHEIGHVLRGDDGHQDSGVMKAHWTAADFRAMSARPYTFTPGDIRIIREYWTVRTAAVIR